VRVRVPTLAGPLLVSSAVHGVLVGALLLAGHISWPSPPLAIELLPPRPSRPRPPSLPTPLRAPRPAAIERTPPSRARAAIKPTPGEGKRPVTPPAPPPPPETADLKPFAPDDANLVILLRGDKLRTSPHRAAVETLLSALPDYHTLLDGTDVSPIDDLDALLIATADPRAVTATFLAARYHDSERLRALASRPLGDGDPRVFRILGPGLTVLTQPDAALKLDGAQQALDGRSPPDGGGGDPRVRWLAMLEQLDQLAGGPGGPTLLVTLADARALLHLKDLPTPVNLALAVTADAAPSLRLRAAFADEAEAQAFAAAWPDILRRWRSGTALLGLAPALDGIKLVRAPLEVTLEGRIPEAQMKIALSWALAVLPRAPAPRRPPPPPPIDAPPPGG
jgi:hypothetical protein